MAQNIDFSGSDQIQTPQYPDVHPPSQEKSNEVFHPNHSVQYKENLENSSNSTQKKEEPPQDSDIRQLIREECCVEASEEQKQNMEDTISLNTKLLSINSQRLEKEQQEVKNVVEQLAERGNHSIQSLQNFRSLMLRTFYQSQVNAKLLQKMRFTMMILKISKEEVDLEDISQIQDVVLREKLLSITRLISNIESLIDNPTPDGVLNSFVSNNSLLDNFSPEFETFCDHVEETRSGNTTHADNSLPDYDLFCFEIGPDQERLINVMKNDIPDDSSKDPLLEEADLFLASDNSIPPGIENVADDSEGDIRFLEELLINDSILSHESSDSNFKDKPSIPRPPPKPPNAETNTGEEIPVVMNDKDKFDEDYYFFMIDKVLSFLSVESEDTIFDPGISI
nr:hypothetical protein [Tanacetum cinerariifolium]